MKTIAPIISAVLLAGSLASAALAGDTIVSRATNVDEGYCHMRFSAIRPRTLAGDHPQLKSPDTGDVIDYYGSCDESPTGKDQVTSQKLDEQFRFGRDYEDGD